MMLYCYINGQYHKTEASNTLSSIDPASSEILYDFIQADKQTIDAAVFSARQAFNPWAQTPAIERANILRKAAGLLRDNNKELALLESLDTGKPLQETLVADVLSGADCLDYYADLANNLPGQHLSQADSFIYTRREPLGVCAGIGAWNYPLQIACWKSAPALAFGNSMVFKPSEFATRTTLKLAELYTQAGLPHGVFNVVTGDGLAGQHLTQHPDIAKISFTGSVETGKKIMRSASDTLKKVTLELGGKSPLIIFDDANLDEAVTAAMLANFYSSGQICSNGTRVFVHEGIHDEFLGRLASRVNQLVIGSPLDKTTHIGPLISKAHLLKVMDYINAGIAEGATLYLGGKVLTDGLYAQGNFMQPTIFTDCSDHMRIVQEEIFGPVMSVLRFKKEDEVIARANHTHFGLAAGVFTRDVQRAHRVINQLQAGVCWINNYNITPIEMPFGGYKQSGLGRENGISGIEQYTQLKSVYVELGKIESPYP